MRHRRIHALLELFLVLGSPRSQLIKEEEHHTTKACRNEQKSHSKADGGPARRQGLLSYGAEG
jgi:hypothetical protein